VFCHPVLIARHYTGEAQRKTFLSQQGVPPIAGTKAKHRFVCRKMSNVGIFRITGPGNIIRRLQDRGTNRMNTTHVIPLVPKNIPHLEADPSHDAHVHDDVRRIRDFNPDFGNG